jgi:hypothetical protein
MARLRRFKSEEHAALERWSEDCRMRGVAGPGASQAPGQIPAGSTDDTPLPDPFEEVKGG